MSQATTPALPNLVIAGVAKAGTTSLFHYLRQHPKICGSDAKELHHYSPLVHGQQPTEPLADYARHFRQCTDEPWRLEATPRYFVGGQALIDAITRDLPGVHVLVLLREPADRLWSSYTYKQSRGRLPPGMDFRGFYARCLELRATGQDMFPENSLYRTLSNGIYVEHLGRWCDALNDRLRIVFFEDLAAEPERAVTGVLRWLGLDPAAIDYTARNRTQQPRSVGLGAAAQRVNAAIAPALRRTPRLKRVVTRAYRRLNTGTFEEKFSGADRARVQDFYAPSLPPLAALLTHHRVRDLPPWLAARGPQS